MGFAINTNNDALNTYRNLSNVQMSLSKSLERLSSGLRINQAGDDAAGLTISTQLGAQVSGLQQASRNAQDGVSLLQTADGSLSQAQSILGRLRDLAVQAGNDSNSTTARNAIKSEATSLVAELDRIGQSVDFNGTKLLDGSSSTLKFQIGANGDAASQVSVSLGSANLRAVSTALSTGALSSGRSFTGFALSDVPTALTFTAGASGSTQTTVPVTGITTPTSYQNLVDQLNSKSAFAAKFTATVTKAADGTPTGFAVAANDGTAVSLDSTQQGTLLTATGSATATGTATAGIQFDTAANAQLAITAINDKLNSISSARADIGALENRFASALSTISTSVQNLTAAKSRITDVDMAQEMVSYTRANVLSQSGTAMLAQANSLPQLALKLLG